MNDYFQFPQRGPFWGAVLKMSGCTDRGEIKLCWEDFIFREQVSTTGQKSLGRKLVVPWVCDMIYHLCHSYFSIRQLLDFFLMLFTHTHTHTHTRLWLEASSRCYSLGI